MKKQTFTLLLSLVSTILFAQDTLQHFAPTTTVPMADEYPSAQGYYTGHNDYADEEFAEKYEIAGSGSVLGVIAIHDGVQGTSSMNASYKIYSVASNGLPGTQLATKSVSNNSIPIDGSLHTVMFSSAASVEDEFFVSFDLGDYAHNDPGTKMIAITHTPDGTRPSSDFDVFGRNAIRWHAHGDVAWKDYRTENFQSYQPAVYFSLFPIVQLNATSVIEFDNRGSSIGSVFPNPTSREGFTVPINTVQGGEAIFQLFDSQGKIVVERQEVLAAGKTDYVFSDNGLLAGTYFLLTRIPEGSVSQVVIIH